MHFHFISLKYSNSIFKKKIGIIYFRSSSIHQVLRSSIIFQEIANPSNRLRKARDKVIIHKSRDEISLVEQDTIEYEYISLAY